MIDSDGQKHDTRLVLPVSRASTTPGQVFAGGSVPRDERRRVLSRRFLQPLKEIVSRVGNISMAQASKMMLQKEGFKRTLAGLRMNFKTFVQLWPDFIIAGTGAGTRLSLIEPLPRARTGTLIDFAEST